MRQHADLTGAFETKIPRISAQSNRCFIARDKMRTCVGVTSAVGEPWRCHRPGRDKGKAL